MGSGKEKGLITENDRIPPQALTVLLVVMIAEINFLGAPRPIAALAGRDAWIATALSMILVGLVFWMLFSLSRRFPDKTLVEIAQHVFGKPLGIAVIIFYIAFWLARAAWLLAIQSHLYTRQLLPETPKFILAGYMLLLSAYLVRHGLEPMARLFITFLGGYAIVLLAIFAFSVTGVEIGRLAPVLAEDSVSILRGTWISFAAVSGLEMILMIGPLLTRFRGALSAGMIGIGFVALPAVALMILLVARFGHETVSEIIWATLILVEQIQVPGFTGFRLDPVFVALWSLLVFGSVALTQYMACSALRRLFRWGDNIWPVVITTTLLGLVFVGPLDLPELEPWFFRLNPIVVPISTVGLPLLILIVAYFRGLWTVQKD